jgi:hypothetical protein
VGAYREAAERPIETRAVEIGRTSRAVAVVAHVALLLAVVTLGGSGHGPRDAPDLWALTALMVASWAVVVTRRIRVVARRPESALLREVVLGPLCVKRERLDVDDISEVRLDAKTDDGSACRLGVVSRGGSFRELAFSSERGYAQAAAERLDALLVWLRDEAQRSP